MALVQLFKDKLVQVLTEASGASSLRGAGIVPGGVQKASVLLESRCFTDTALDTSLCVNVISKILYILSQGEQFTSEEATDLFFRATRLFQSKSVHLRRLTHQLIKSLKLSENEVFIVTSSLTKDMSGSNEFTRANAIRTLAHVADAGMFNQLERFMKAAIMDRCPHVASSALVSSLHMCHFEVVRRWVNEVTECVSSKHSMVQFHALALLCELRKSDRLALHKIIGDLTLHSVKSPMSECLLIRYAGSILMGERGSQLESSLMSYLEYSLRHRSEIVIVEAARTFLKLAACGSRAETGSTGTFSQQLDLGPTVTALQMLLSNQKPIVRYAAISTLNKLAKFKPELVSRCNLEIEPLLYDPNKLVAVQALTTMLKTSPENGVEKLVKHISTLLTDLTPTHREEIVDATGLLALTFQSKAKVLVNFLSSQLREEGGIQFKYKVVETIMSLSLQIPSVHDESLSHLCEFIEDCEFQSLTCFVIGFLAERIPHAVNHTKYIRYIYNRLILENATIRACSVHALCHIASQFQDLRGDLVQLLAALEFDTEDEIRDRTKLLVSYLQSGKPQELIPPSPDDEDANLPLSGIVVSLGRHIAAGHAAEPFDFDSIEIEEIEESTHEKGQVVDEAATPSKSGVEVQSMDELLKQKICVLDDTIHLGDLHNSTSSLYLTEKEAEYVVQVVSHFWTESEYVLFEFSIFNTLDSEVLQQVSVDVKPSEGWEVALSSQIPAIGCSQTSQTYVLVRRRNPTLFNGVFGCTLQFLLKEQDDPIGYPDSYIMESIVLTPGMFLAPAGLPRGEFNRYWTQLDNEPNAEVTTRLCLGHLQNGVASGIQTIKNQLCMSVCDKSDFLESEGSTQATITLAGRLVSSQSMVLCKATLALSGQHGVLGKVIFRSTDPVSLKVLSSCFTQ